MQERKRLYKSANDRMIFGVGGGLADYFGIDPVLMRLILVALAFISAGTMVVVYLIAAIIMPTANTGA
jgi:phage shock protein PspC (stress-responsive transcriptional regulator)